MTKALTQQDLDAMACEGPGCDHTAHSGPMIMQPRCHPRVGALCVYQDGVVTVRCRSCSKLVVRFAVDPGNVVRH